MTTKSLLFTMATVGLAHLFLLGYGSAIAQDATPTEPPPPPDVLTLGDGSKVVGQIVGMEGGELQIETAFGGSINVKWEEIKTIESPNTQTLILSDGSSLVGTLGSDAQGNLIITTAAAAQPVNVGFGSVTAVTPVPKKPVTYTINVNAGGSIADGNTRTKTLNANAEFVARSERNRLTLRGQTTYAEDEGDLSARNSSATVKYDFFMTTRLYAFVEAFLEGDEFQNLSLRTALSAGLGYQWIDKGDFKDDAFKDMQFYTEAGLAYFNEDFDNGVDDRYASARWAMRLDWPFVPDRLTLFHYHVGYPGLENSDDIYISTEQGLRMTIIDNFVATAQVNWRWDNTPSPGFRRSDTLYIFTLGYAAEL